MSNRLLCNIFNLEFRVSIPPILPLWIRQKSVGRPLDVSLPQGIKHALDDAVPRDRQEVAAKLASGDPLYPNNDVSILWRSCLQEVLEPLAGQTTGAIPPWVQGSLLRNGPGLSQIGEDKFQHWFDGPAMVHRFGIADGKVTYQCRFLQTNTYRKNMAAGRIACSEFGTGAPDPCRTIFQRVSSIFKPGEVTDNAMISVYPFGEDLYCFTESPVIHRVDPTTLKTLERVDVSKHVSVMSHTSHPHVTTDGSVYNQAMTVAAGGPSYTILKFPAADAGGRSKEMFEAAEVVASVRARWPLHPSYMHTFGLTDNFYVVVEQPLTISVPTMVKSQLRGDEKLTACFKYFPDEQTLFHVVERSTGNLFKTFSCEPFFFFHIVNQYEKEHHVVIDICCYSDGSMIDALYRDAMENMNKDPDYARLFRGRPLRFVLPLKPSEEENTNLVTLTGSSAAAWRKDGKVIARPELLCNIGCEMPRINYDRYLGRPYRYFYGVSSDVDGDNPGSLVKVDTEGRTAETWREPGVFASEPVFVPSPQPKAEDDGVLLVSLLWGEGRENQVALLVLDATNLRELSRTMFQTPSAVPKDLHGWFASTT